jgi:hypothetical protein
LDLAISDVRIVDKMTESLDCFDDRVKPVFAAMICVRAAKRGGLAAPCNFP